MHLPIRLATIAILIAPTHSAEFTPAAEAPIVRSPALGEASGIAPATQATDALWAINDSGGTPDLHLLRTDGTDLGTVTITNAKNIDWEDLAAFTLGGKSYLLIADTGDNSATRKSCTLHIVPEPKLPTPGKKLSGSATSSWSIVFTYDGGPRDCEAVAVDTLQNKIILISKRTSPPELYELPLRPTQKRGTLIAKKIGTVTTQSAKSHFIPFANQPVGLDINADQSLAAIVTYYTVFLFPRAPHETWPQAFAKKPSTLPPHALPQAESIAFDSKGQSIHILSEGKNQLIRTYRR